MTHSVPQSLNPFEVCAELLVLQKPNYESTANQ
jgi:hypothetical protein